MRTQRDWRRGERASTWPPSSPSRRLLLPFQRSCPSAARARTPTGARARTHTHTRTPIFGALLACQLYCPSSTHAQTRARTHTHTHANTHTFDEASLPCQPHQHQHHLFPPLHLLPPRSPSLFPPFPFLSPPSSLSSQSGFCEALLAASLPHPLPQLSRLHTHTQHTSCRIYCPHARGQAPSPQLTLPPPTPPGPLTPPLHSHPLVGNRQGILLDPNMAGKQSENACTHARTHARTCTHMHARTHTHAWTHVHAFTRMDSRARIHTHGLTCEDSHACTPKHAELYSARSKALMRLNRIEESLKDAVKVCECEPASVRKLAYGPRAALIWAWACSGSH